MPAAATISSATFFRPDLAELVERAQHGADRSARPMPLQQAGEQHAVVQADGEIADADRPQQVVDHQGRLDVGGGRAGADGVEVALHELAVAAAPAGVSPRQTVAM